MTDSASSAVALAAGQLAHWPEAQAAQLTALMRANAHCGAYAVFDADNTSYRHDLIGALLPFMEMQGVLTRATMAPSLKLIAFKDSASYQESLNSYYLRLGEIDDQVAYPWASQIFAGFTLRQLKAQLDALMAHGQPIPSRCWVGERVETLLVDPPVLLRGQQALYQALMHHGIAVYVVSAASEELVRMLLCDPQYGYHVQAENVIGVSLLLKDRRNGSITTARKLIAEKRYHPHDLLDHEMSTTLWAPLPWYEGKQAAIHTYVHPWKKPVLVAGDTPESDGPMLFRGPDVEQGALRLFVSRTDSALQKIQHLQAQHAAAQSAQGLTVNAHHNWVVVTPEQIQ